MLSQKTKSILMLVLMMCGVSHVNMAPLPNINFNDIITNTRNDVNDRFNRMRLEVLRGIKDKNAKAALRKFRDLITDFYGELHDLKPEELMAAWIKTSQELFKIFDDESIERIEDKELKLFVKSQLRYMVSTLNLMFIMHEDNEIDALSNSLRIMINFSDTRLRLQTHAINTKGYLADVKRYAETLARDTLVNLGKIGKSSKDICDMYIAESTDGLSRVLDTAFAEAKAFQLTNIKDKNQEGKKEQLRGILAKINLIVNLLEILVLKDELSTMVPLITPSEGKTLTADVDEVNQMDWVCERYTESSLQSAAATVAAEKEALAAKRRNAIVLTGVNGQGALQMGTSADVPAQRPRAVRFNDNPTT